MTIHSDVDTLLIQTVAEAGGKFVGTAALVQAVPADERHTMRRIRDLCQRRILRRTNQQAGGRGIRQVYRLQRSLCNPGEKETTL